MDMYRMSHGGIAIPINGRTQAHKTTNPKTGSGGRYDNSASIGSQVGLYSGAAFTLQDRDGLIEIYKHDKLLQKAINIPVTDSLINWREITDPAYSQLDLTLKVKQTFMKAAKKARLTGGCLIIPIIVNSSGAKVPLATTMANLERVREKYEVVNLILVDNYTPSNELITDTADKKHGEPLRYINENTGKPIHSSRAIEVKPDSLFFTAVKDYFYKFHFLSDELKRAVEESNRLFFETDFEWVAKFAKAQNTAMGTQKPATQHVFERVDELRRNANTSNVFSYDKNHEGIKVEERKNIGAVKDAVQKFLEILAAVSDVPVSRFAGTASGGGLANTSRADLQNYLMALEGFRLDLIEEPLMDFDDMFVKLGLVKNVTFTWNPFTFERFIEQTIAEEQAQEEAE